MPRNLQETLQALYDSEINVTITTLWDGGYDFALCSYMVMPMTTCKMQLGITSRPQPN